MVNICAILSPSRVEAGDSSIGGEREGHRRKLLNFYRRK